MHHALRGATHDAHNALDGMFGALDLSREPDFARFLAAHYIGLRPLYPAYRAFVAEELGIAPPDFPAMLRRDLQALDHDEADLPEVRVEQAVVPAGITYVLAGSRLGLAMIRKQGYWSRGGDTAREYMEDTTGIDVWRRLSAWMAAQSPAPEVLTATCASAALAFDVFRQAFALSANLPRR